jgi:hypothetical protein
MFGFNKNKAASSTTIEFGIDTPVLFHKECNGHIEHGKLAATHATLGVTKNDGVRFAFQGIEPPMLTPAIMAYIFDQAERKGYVVSHLHSYCNVVTQVPAPKLNPRDDAAAPVLHTPPSRLGDHQRGVARTPRRPSGPRADASQAS